MGSIGPTAQVPAHAMPLLSPSALLHAHVSRDPPRRPSGRLPNQARTIDLNVGSLTHTNGSALVKIGATTVVAGVRAEILDVRDIPSFRVHSSTSTSDSSNPTHDTSDEDNDKDDELELGLYNLLVPNLELSTGCSPRHPANTAPSIEAQSILQRLLSLLLTSRLIRLKDLEIWQHPPPPSSSTQTPNPGVDDDQPRLRGYWTLYIDILCISYAGSGSVFDASWLATVAALRDTLLPHAEWDVDEERIVCSADVEAAHRLRLRGMPVPLSFGVFVPERRDVGAGVDELEKGTRLLVDLEGLEEEVCQEVGCVVVDEGGEELVRVEKSGGGCVGVGEVRELVKVAGERWREWVGVLGKALEERR